MSFDQEQAPNSIQREYEVAERIAAENNRTIRLLKAKLEIAKCNKEEMAETLKYYENKYEEQMIEFEDISWKQAKAKVILKSTQEYIDKKNKSQNCKLFAEVKEEICYDTEAPKIQIQNDYLKKNCDENADKIKELMKKIKEIKEECRQLDK